MGKRQKQVTKRLLRFSSRSLKKLTRDKRRHARSWRSWHRWGIQELQVCCVNLLILALEAEFVSALHFSAFVRIHRIVLRSPKAQFGVYFATQQVCAMYVSIFSNVDGLALRT